MPENSPMTPTTITADQLTDLCSDGKRPSVEQIAEHFRSTIFWNWAEPVAEGLDDESRIECEFPLTVGEAQLQTPDEPADGVERLLRFESGECVVSVATMYESGSDETAREVDAHFVACLPVYLPVLFREIATLTRERDDLAAKLGEIATKLQTIVCVLPPDDGVVLLSQDGPCHVEVHGGKEISVYDHEHFSPLGDALMELWKIINRKATP